jgi:hypothetical protein
LPEFWALYDALPKEIQEQANKQYAISSKDPLHPSLQLKAVGDLWSVRISRSYRALAVRRGDRFFWFWIGSHDEYDRILYD